MDAPSRVDNALWPRHQPVEVALQAMEEQLIRVLETLAELRAGITHIREGQDTANTSRADIEGRLRVVEDAVRDARSKLQLLQWIGSAVGIGGLIEALRHLK